MKYSIIITTCGNHLEDYLKPCIESIVKYTSLDNSEVIVVANGCDSATKGYVESLGGPFRLLWFAAGIGYTKAANAGLRAATGEYIVLLNDDTTLLEQPKDIWMNILSAPFDKDNKVGMTGPVKFTWDCGGIKRTALAFWCVMIRRSLFCELGFLDEVFNPGMGEDGDYCVRAELIGYKLVQVPVDGSKEFGTGVDNQKFPIYHKGNGTFGETNDLKDEIVARNHKVLSDRYASRLEKVYDNYLRHESDINRLFPTLRKYAIRCNHVTEFGVRGVFSTYALLAAKPVTMRSYDIYTSPNINEAISVAVENSIDFRFIEKSTLEAEIENTDLLFIDTLHTYGQLSKELKRHEGKVRKYIMMHDTESWGTKDEIKPEGGTKEGLMTAVNDFLLDNGQWKLKEVTKKSNGLTVLERVPKYSIVIPTHNRRDILEQCLTKVFAYTDLTDKEVIVVPNGCTDGTLDYLDSVRKKIRILNMPESVGQVIPAQEGVRRAKGEFVVLLDDDCYLLEQPVDSWINILVTPLADIKVGISGVFAAEYPYLGKVMHNGCTMFRKSVWERVGGFDDVFGYGYLYDTDFSLRVRKEGYSLANVGDGGQFPIYHPDSSVTTETKQKQVSLIRKNREILYRRHGMKPKFSIVVPTYNHLEDCLKPCLESIKQYTDLSQVEVLVVANGCKDATAAYVDSLGYPFKLTWFDAELGYITATNVGIKEAQGDYVVLLNNDTILTEQPKNEWLRLLEAGLSTDNVSIVGPHLHYWASGINRYFIIFWCTMVKKSLFDTLGYLDEVYSPGYCEDADFCFRAQNVGYQVKQVSIGIKHKEHQTMHPEGAHSVKNLKILESRYRADLSSETTKSLKDVYAVNTVSTRKPKFSVVLPTYNHLEDCLKPCLESMVKHTDFADMEVIVVANGCKDNTAEYVKSLGSSFKLLWFDDKIGFTKATNEGIKHAQGEYIILLNNDIVLLDQKKNTWLTMLEAPFLTESKVGITGPLMLFDRYANSDVMIFFCVMMKKALFDELGLLDEIFSPGGGEDIDFCVKALHAGYTQVVVPDNKVEKSFTNVGKFPIYHKGEGTFSATEWPEYGKKIIKDNGLVNLLRYNEHIKLNLGSGGVEFPGYLSVDKYDLRASLILDATDLNKHFPENSVEELLASHLFEHVNPYESVAILKKWFQVLKPGCKLILELPNIEELCKDFVTADKQGRYGILNGIYGSVNTRDTANNDKGEITSPHLWGWYPEIMYDHLVWAGFKDIVFGKEQIPHPYKNFRVEATKPLVFRDAMDEFIYSIVAPGDHVLDLGCGDKSRTKFLNRNNKVTSVDAWEKTNPDMVVDLEKESIPLPENSVDVVLMVDFIEHLSKTAGIRVMSEAIKVSKKKVVLFTPSFWTDNKENVNNPELWCYQNQFDCHKSLWSAEDFAGWQPVQYPDDRFYLRVWNKV